MAPRQTRLQIIQSAIVVLKIVGTEGLSLRNVAAQADISLGNLQYHFKSRPALMAGLAEHYFAECAELLGGYEQTPIDGTRDEQLQHFIRFLLDHVDHISDMCRIFREIWALSTRDDAVHSQLVSYYETSMSQITRLLADLGEDEPSARRIATLLVPFMEGFSITHEALPLTTQQAADILFDASVALR